MEQTVLGFFEDNRAARRAADELIKKGFSSSQIDIAMPESTEEDVQDERREESGIKRFFKSLFGEGENADRYSNVSSGYAMVTVHTQTAEEAEEAADIMDDCGAVDIDEHSEDEAGSLYLNEGRNASRDQDLSRDQSPQRNLQNNLQTELNEERNTERQRSRIVGRPVEETARMRQQEPRDEQNQVDQSASAKAPALELFKEGEIELTEHKEVPLVQKEARVVEEIKVKKVIEDREETVHETVRKTDVEIERLEAQKRDAYIGLTESETDGKRNADFRGDKKRQDEINREKEDWEKRSSGDPLFDA